MHLKITLLRKNFQKHLTNFFVPYLLVNSTTVLFVTKVRFRAGADQKFFSRWSKFSEVKISKVNEFALPRMMKVVVFFQPEIDYRQAGQHAPRSLQTCQEIFSPVKY